MTSIWGAGTAGGTLTTTMRLPVDTSSTSGSTNVQGLDVMNGVLGNIVAGNAVTLTPNTTTGTLTIASSLVLTTTGTSGTATYNATTGALNIPNYATGGGTYTPPVTTKGDLFGFDTAANRVPVGTNGQVLTADSTTALGVAWKTSTTGSGTVNSGTAGQFALYTATGTAVSGLALYTYDTTAGLINGIALNAGASGAGAVIVPTLTGADTSASLTIKAAGSSQYSTVIGTSTWNTSYNGSTTQRILLTTTAATFGSGLAVTISSTLTVTGATTHTGFTTHSSGLSAPTRAVTASTTTTTSDYAVFASGTGVTITLHTPTTGQLLNVKNTNASGGANITLAGTGTDAGTTTITPGANLPLIYDTAGAIWRAQ